MKTPSNELVARITDTLLNMLVSFARAHGYDDVFVIRCLFAATGTFGMKTERQMFFRTLNEFINVTRKLYPDFTFDDDPYMRQYRQMLEAAALEEKQHKTVH